MRSALSSISQKVCKHRLIQTATRYCFQSLHISHFSTTKHIVDILMCRSMHRMLRGFCSPVTVGVIQYFLFSALLTTFKSPFESWHHGWISSPLVDDRTIITGKVAGTKPCSSTYTRNNLNMSRDKVTKKLQNNESSLHEKQNSKLKFDLDYLSVFTN